MKKIIINLILLLTILFISLIIILSTVGIETNKFNKLISDKASQEKNIFLNLKTIKFKINPKRSSLFLETENPSLSYKNLKVPLEKIKVYMDFTSLIKSQFKINKIIPPNSSPVNTSLKIFW